MLSDATEFVVVCARNDEESLQIIKITEAFKIPCFVSLQPHGARLEKEPDFLQRLADDYSHAKRLVVIEMPGVEMEARLVELGYEVSIIDHHRYPGLDRMKQESSLEQFLSFFAIENVDLERHGFDPLLVRSVGVIDRGFFWELAKEGFSEEDRRKAIAYYLALRDELALFNPEAADEARRIFEAREERDGILIFQGAQARFRIREELSFLLAEHYPDQEPTSIIFERDGKVSVQNTLFANTLSERFGGYQFGKGLCWGKMLEEPTSGRDTLPTLFELLEIISSV
ncbi:hypothetical protein KBC55_03830 [Patescibacteria group bacterium]|nr:hypothetical protein [Patescibacteria group bacterium]